MPLRQDMRNERWYASQCRDIQNEEAESLEGTAELIVDETADHPVTHRIPVSGGGVICRQALRRRRPACPAPVRYKRE